MQLAIYLVVLAVALGLFAFSVYRRLTVLQAARPEPRVDQPAERVRGVLQHVFGQWRLIHGDAAAGWMHCLIFWGFVILLLNTLAFLIGGPVGNFEFWLLGHAQPLGKVYFTVKDFVELIVLAAVGYAAYRRVVIRPARLHFTGEALVILGLIALLMVSDWVLAGAGTVMNSYAGWQSPSEVLFGAFWVNNGPVLAQAIYTVAWWIHLFTLLLFLNLLPLGKHFHVLLSVFNVYFRPLEPARAMRALPIDLEADELPPLGVARPEQLSWKNWFDSYNCTECGRCDYFCPAHQTGKVLSPQQIITNTRDLIYRYTPLIIRKLAQARATGGALELFAAGEGPGEFAGTVHADEALWACTTCGACDTHCPLFIEHVEPILEMRRHLVLEEEGRFPTELVATFTGLERQGNPWNLPAHTRMDWAHGYGLPTVSERPDAEWIWFVGCFQSLDERNKETARALYELLNHANVSFAVLDAETCCGDPARRCGNELVAQELIETNAEQFRAASPKKVFTACPHCFNALQAEYAQFGVEFEEVLHHSELLVRLINSGKLMPLARNVEGPEPPLRRIVFHDSCYLGRLNAIYDEPRRVLRETRGVELTEAEFKRDKGYCCGAGGGRMFMEEPAEQRVNTWRYAQLSATGAGEIAVACPFCMVMLDDAAKDAAGNGAAKPVQDIAVVLRDALLGIA